MNTELKEKITTKLQKSSVDQELKGFFLGQLGVFSEAQAEELLRALESEEEMTGLEAERANSELLKKLMVDMKVLSQDWTRKTKMEIERREVQQNEATLKSLEEDLNSI